MRDLNNNLESPLKLLVSFNKIFKYYEELAVGDDEFIAAKARRVLKRLMLF